MFSTHTPMEEDEYDLPYPQQSSRLPPPKWDDEIPILMNQIPSAGQQQGRQRGRNFPYEYINNLPRANVNDGSMLILSVPLHELWEEVIGRWESSTILHCSNISFANNQEKVHYIENLLEDRTQLILGKNFLDSAGGGYLCLGNEFIILKHVDRIITSPISKNVDFQVLEEEIEIPEDSYIIVECDGSLSGWGGVLKWKPHKGDLASTERVARYASGKYKTEISSIDA
ncbi:hypothetical protein K1719_002408 [Acacia pycnantha]|nr:hypothetical protein K1719_002408 [Acacia pycnantha]